MSAPFSSPEAPQPAEASAAGGGRLPDDRTDVLGRRVVATIVDLIPLFVIFLVLALLLGDTSTDDDGASATLEGAPALLLGLCTLLYYGIFEATLGATPGKLALGLRVVSETGGKPSTGAIVIRTLARILDGLCFYAVGFIALLATGRRRQRVGDLAAKTHVVRVQQASSGAPSAARRRGGSSRR
jgi:uncharacterized RDD family membrane protein YckC